MEPQHSEAIMRALIPTLEAPESRYMLLFWGYILSHEADLVIPVFMLTRLPPSLTSALEHPPKSSHPTLMAL